MTNVLSTFVKCICVKFLCCCARVLQCQPRWRPIANHQLLQNCSYCRIIIASKYNLWNLCLGFNPYLGFCKMSTFLDFVLYYSPDSITLFWNSHCSPCHPPIILFSIYAKGSLLDRYKILVKTVTCMHLLLISYLNGYTTKNYSLFIHNICTI